MGIFDIFKSGKRRKDDSQRKQRVSLSELNDPLELADFAKNGPNSRLRKAAVRRIPSKHIEILQGIIFEATDYKVKIAAVNRIKDKHALAEIYRKCAEVDVSKSVRSALVKRMTDTAVLTDISENDKSDLVCNAARRRLLSLGPKICSYTVKMDCPHCSNPVMLNGPILNTACGYCLSELTIPKKFWGHILRVKDSTMFSHLCGFRNVEIKCYLTSVRCSSCNTVLDASEITAGTTEPVSCPQCNFPNECFPAPEWMRRMIKYSAHPDQVFCAVREEGDVGEEAPDSKPVLFSCMQCGGSLKVTADTPRVMACSYCGASQYLPDELWRALHPAKKKKEWFVRWSRGTP